MGQIEMLDKNIMEACRLYVDNLIKPLHALGKLEDMAVRLAGITETVKPRQIKKAVVVVAGDTAVDKENETGGKQSLLEFRALAKGLAPVSAVARMMEIPLYLVDAGLESDTTGIEGALVKKVIKGTHRGNRAMTREQAAEAITLGMSVARSLAAQGVNAVGLGSALSVFAFDSQSEGEPNISQIDKFPKNSIERYAYSKAVTNHTSFKDELEKAKTDVVPLSNDEYVTYKRKTY